LNVCYLLNTQITIGRAACLLIIAIVYYTTLLAAAALRSVCHSG